MCNCTIQRLPPTPTKSDIQFLCTDHTNTTTKDNLSVPTELHITNSISTFPDEPASSPPITMNTTCEPKQAKHDSRQFNLPVVENSREISVVTVPSVVEQQGPQSFTSLSGVHNNLNIDYGMSKCKDESVQMSCGIECMDTMQTPSVNQAEQIRSADLTDLLTPQILVNTVQQQHCETCV